MVFVKNISKLVQRFGQLGPVAPGDSVEISEFEYHGSLAGDPSWELIPPVSTSAQLPEEAEVVPEEAEVVPAEAGEYAVNKPANKTKPSKE